MNDRRCRFARIPYALAGIFLLLGGSAAAQETHTLDTQLLDELRSGIEQAALRFDELLAEPLNVQCAVDWTTTTSSPHLQAILREKYGPEGQAPRDIFECDFLGSLARKTGTKRKTAFPARHGPQRTLCVRPGTAR